MFSMPTPVILVLLNQIVKNQDMLWIMFAIVLLYFILLYCIVLYFIYFNFSFNFNFIFNLHFVFTKKIKKKKVCDSLCQKCDGPGSYNCSTCATGSYLNNGTCVTSCPTGFYGNVLTCSRTFLLSLFFNYYYFPSFCF